MYICLHYSLHGYIFITLQVHFYTTVNQCVNKSIRQWTTEASKIRPFSTKGIRLSVELQDNSCFFFCFVQSLEDNFTKLCCAKRVEMKANGNYHRKIIQRLPNTNGSFVLVLDFRHGQHTFLYIARITELSFGAVTWSISTNSPSLIHKSSKLDGMESLPLPSMVITVRFMPFLPLQANAPWFDFQRQICHGQVCCLSPWRISVSWWYSCDRESC